MDKEDRDRLVRVEEGVEHIKDSLANFKAACNQYRGNCVTRHEFQPIKSLVYGAARLLLVAVLGAMVVGTLHYASFEGTLTEHLEVHNGK